MNDMDRPMLYKLVIEERVGEFETYHESLVHGTVAQVHEAAKYLLETYYDDDTTVDEDGAAWDKGGSRMARLSGINPIITLPVTDLSNGECLLYRMVPEAAFAFTDLLLESSKADLRLVNGIGREFWWLLDGDCVLAMGYHAHNAPPGFIHNMSSSMAREEYGKLTTEGWRVDQISEDMEQLVEGR